MKRTIGAVLTLVVGTAILVGIGLGFGAQKYQATAGTQGATPDGTIVYQGQTMQHVVLTLNSWNSSCGMFNPTTNSYLAPSQETSTNTAGYVPIHHSCNATWPAYGPSNEFSVPAHAYVTVKWNQYDSGGQLNNNYFAYPHGIVGSELVNGKPVTHVPFDAVAHTFTLRPLPGVDPGYLVSVASQVQDASNPGNGANNAKPSTVQFSFISGNKGLYAWNCEFPCGNGIAGFGGVMSSYGFMSGYVHVN